MRLQNKLVLLIIPLVVLPLLGLGWISYKKMELSARETSLGEMDTIARQLTLNIFALVHSAEANIVLFTNSALLKKYVLIEDEQQRFTLLQKALLDLFSTYQTAYPEYFEIRVLLPDGSEDTRLVNGEVPNATEQEGETPYFRHLAASSKPVYSELVLTPDTDKLVLMVGKALTLRDPAVQTVETAPRLRAYLVLSCRLDVLERQIETLSGDGRNTILLTDAQGRLLFTSEGTDGDEPQNFNLIKTLQKTDEGERFFRFRYRGEMTLFQVDPVTQDFYVFIGRPERILLAASHQLGLAIAAVTLVSILVTTLSLFAVLRRVLLKPIERLRKAVQEIGRGNLLATAAVTSRDELGELAQSFCEMSRSLDESHRQIETLAYHDSLTGLPNRLMFKEYLNRSLAHLKRTDGSLALMFIDLDNFKHVNDTLGHEAGDALLREVAERLNSSVREEDIVARVDSPLDMVARLGGDEFVIQLGGLSGTADVGRVARRILHSLVHPVRLLERDIYVSASIGITVAPGDGLDAETLVCHADIAMYHAKQHGKNQYCYYDDEMNARVVQHLALDTKLRRAVDHHDFTLHYQPIVELVTGRLLGVEALLRWEDPELGLMPTANFIRIGEEIGLMMPISEWVLTEACRQLIAWHRAGFGKFSVAVNLSGLQVNQRAVRAMLARALASSELSPQYLEIELTETSLMSVDTDVVQMLNYIKQLGVKIAIDDFGTGYSSLNYLRNFPLDHLKIDRSFISDLSGPGGNQAIVAAIVAMAHSLGLRVIAEGVETETQMKVLHALGCDCVQGYLFCHPLAPSDLARLLDQQILPWAHLQPTNVVTPPREASQHQR